ncbi:MAG: hypothetical protein ACRDDF_08440, partial [Aeromonas sp.]
MEQDINCDVYDGFFAYSTDNLHMNQTSELTQEIDTFPTSFNSNIARYCPINTQANPQNFIQIGAQSSSSIKDINVGNDLSRKFEGKNPLIGDEFVPFINQCDKPYNIFAPCHTDTDKTALLQRNEEHFAESEHQISMLQTNSDVTIQGDTFHPSMNMHNYPVSYQNIDSTNAYGEVQRDFQNTTPDQLKTLTDLLVPINEKLSEELYSSSQSQAYTPNPQYDKSLVDNNDVNYSQYSHLFHYNENDMAKTRLPDFSIFNKEFLSGMTKDFKNYDYDLQENQFGSHESNPRDPEDSMVSDCVSVDTVLNPNSFHETTDVTDFINDNLRTDCIQINPLADNTNSLTSMDLSNGNVSIINLFKKIEDNTNPAFCNLNSECFNNWDVSNCRPHYDSPCTSIHSNIASPATNTTQPVFFLENRSKDIIGSGIIGQNNDEVQDIEPTNTGPEHLKITNSGSDITTISPHGNEDVMTKSTPVSVHITLATNIQKPTIFDRENEPYLRDSSIRHCSKLLEVARLKNIHLPEYEIRSEETLVFMSLVVYFDNTQIPFDRNRTVQSILEKICLNCNVEIIRKMRTLVDSKIINEVDSFRKTRNFIKWGARNIVKRYFGGRRLYKHLNFILKSKINEYINRKTTFSNEDSFSQIRNLLKEAIDVQIKTLTNEDLII